MAPSQQPFMVQSRLYLSWLTSKFSDHHSDSQISFIIVMLLWSLISVVRLWSMLINFPCTFRSQSWSIFCRHQEKHFGQFALNNILDWKYTVQMDSAIWLSWSCSPRWDQSLRAYQTSEVGRIWLRIDQEKIARCRTRLQNTTCRRKQKSEVYKMERKDQLDIGDTRFAEQVQVQRSKIRTRAKSSVSNFYIFSYVSISLSLSHTQTAKPTEEEINAIRRLIIF